MPLLEAEGIGWAPIVTLGLAAAMSLLSYGDSNRRNKRAAEDLAKLDSESAAALAEVKRDCAAQFAEVRSKTEALADKLSAYQLQVEREYPRKVDLAAMENRLVAKFEELKVDFGRKSIAHEVKNAVTAALAQHTLTAKGKLP